MIILMSMKIVREIRLILVADSSLKISSLMYGLKSEQDGLILLTLLNSYMTYNTSLKKYVCLPMDLRYTILMDILILCILRMVLFLMWV
nr:MAG TPA: hypothetical protein [Caudoviricetes sp.]